MRIYHFSVRFYGSDMSYHGEFMTNSIQRNDIVQLAKIKLTEKMKVWKWDGKDVVFFEVYRFDDDGNEVSVFKFEK